MVLTLSSCSSLRLEARNLSNSMHSSVTPYIVHLNSPEGLEFSQPHQLEEWYNSFLSEVAFSTDERPKLVYAYRRVITGFAAKMSADQANVMENLGRVLFGITPGHPSFNDKGMPPPPPRWKGKCEIAGCNNKLIGIRNFVSHDSAIDNNGHGTQTSSTAAGNYVDNVSIFEQANGTASGMAPRAHLAMYKVCRDIGCPSSAILAAMDAAIEEGVDVLSISLGGPPLPFYTDSVAIGAFTAIQSGIFVSTSAVYLGNKKILNGEALYQPKNYKPKFRPLVYPAEKGYSCSKESLDHIDVKGKVVLCDNGVGVDMVKALKYAGGAAMILANNNSTVQTVEASYHMLPSSHVVGVKSAPEVTDFSSRGPNSVSPGIMKPDILGPGIGILAAWPKPVVGTKKMFALDLGTSISCPHIAGIAALLRSTHPEWSPAAIKSAIMTTASHVSLSGKPIVDERDIPADVFAIGAGHVKASKANDPGLIFDIQPDDYIPYLCGLGYTPKQVQTIVKKTVSCSKTIPEAQLNYPSFVVALKRGETKTYSRTVTNVGKGNSTYTIGDVSLPQGFNIEISTHSQQLSFTALHRKISYEVTFARDSKDHVKGPWGGGYMTWVSGKYSVKTPFAIMYN
ncbi:peptidase S8/S53 domain-containing protein [Tanacetum coccineum]